jgi:DAACS family dicarboxylate/amino acid:cation (Na+ or H+) symporter
MVGIPVEGIGMILGVDRLLDMCRTTLNVTGDLAAAVVVSRGEAPLPPLHPLPEP